MKSSLLCGSDRRLLAAVVAQLFASASGWGQCFDQQHLLPPAPMMTGSFGNALAMNDTWLVIGAQLDQMSGSGDVIIKRWSGSGWVMHTASLAAITSPALHNNDGFGFLVQLGKDAGGADLIAVTANYGDVPGQNDIGTVDLYRFDPSVDQWQHVQRLQSPAPQPTAEFGHYVLIDATGAILVGELQANGGAGAAYVYPTQGTGWLASPSQSLLPSCLQIGLPNNRQLNIGRFGSRMAYDQNTWIIAAGGSIVDSQTQALLYSSVGCAFVYERDAFGVWQQGDVLVPPQTDWVNFLGFGTDQALVGDLLMVSGPAATVDDCGAPLSRAGKCYFYARTGAAPVPCSSPGPSWKMLPNLTLTSPAPLALENFGTRADMKGRRIIVGQVGHETPVPGKAYVFERDDRGTPANFDDDRITCAFELCDPAPASMDQFGIDVTLDGADRYAVGIRFDDSSGVIDAGAVAAFDLHHSAFTTSGAGCVHCAGPDVPVLCVAGNPKVGGKVALSVQDAPATATLALLFVGVAPAHMPVGFGCFVDVAPFAYLTALPLTCAPDGISTFSTIPPMVVPPIAQLPRPIGFQAFVPNGPLNCLSATAAVLFVIGC